MLQELMGPTRSPGNGTRRCHWSERVQFSLKQEASGVPTMEENEAVVGGGRSFLSQPEKQDPDRDHCNL